MKNILSLMLAPAIGPVQNNVMSLMRGPDEIFFVFKNFLPRVMEQSESMVMGGEEMDGAD